MIIKLISKIIKFDKTFFLFLFLIFLSGLFKQFFLIFFLIIIHEIGHFLVAKLFKWKIEVIKIYPSGGCVFFNEDLNKPIYQELLILLFGPIFQIIGYFLFYYLYQKGYIFYQDFIALKTYNYTLLFFNLLPIYPLDGGKILNLIFHYIFNYKFSNKLIIIISYLFVFIMLFFNKNINLTFMLFLLLIEITKYLKNQSYIYNKFLLERYLKFYNFKKYKIIKDYKKMYRGKRHVIKNKESYITEKEYLKNYFRRNL